ncbi:MAG: type II toxin-antitoxin system RelE/ParE family toxin [Peptococcaceae bacterium]|nr:type II toxin-antitoxin system RelE/ParE family toxin [Peptococcaceae bacterium]
MTYNVIISNSAYKVIKRTDKTTRKRLINRIKELQKSPFSGDVQPLKGLPGEFRTRVGDWRILYAVDKESLTITVLKVSPRGNAYK